MAAVIPYLLIAAGAGVSAHSQRETEKKRKRIIDAMQEFQTGKAQQGQKAIGEFLDKSAPEARAAETSAIRDELSSGLRESVDAAHALETPDNFAGQVSESYATRKASNEATTKARLERAMQQLAVIGSPAERGLRENIRFGRAGSSVDAANSAINAVRPAYVGSAERVRPSEFETFLSQVLGGVGMGMASGSSRGTITNRNNLGRT